MKNTPVSLRPREKLARLGPACLSDVELWTCVLGSGTRALSVEEMASRVARSAPVRLRGAHLARVQAVRELILRSTRQGNLLLQAPRDVLLLCQDIAYARKEWLVALYCSVKGELLWRENLALGGINVAHLRPAELFLPLRSQPVASLILCHNHPSGGVEPSGEDKVFTARIAAACEILGLQLNDHLILGRDQYYSFRENNLLTDGKWADTDEEASGNVALPA